MRPGDRSAGLRKSLIGLVRKPLVVSGSSKQEDAQQHDRDALARLVGDVELSGDLTQQLRWQNRSLLQLVHAFLPALVRETLEDGGWLTVREYAPMVQPLDGCLLQICCSSFLGLIDGSSHGAHAAGLISKGLRRFFGPVVDVIMAYGGDVIRINGGGLTVFFKAADDYGRFKSACGSMGCSHSPAPLACLRAAACCLELQKRVPLLAKGLDSMGQMVFRMGVSAGSMTFLGISGNSCTSLESFEFAVAGPPVEHAAQAARLAGPCEIVLCPQAWRHVEYTCISGLPPEGHADFQRLEGFDVRQHTYPMVRHAAQQSARADLSDMMNSQAVRSRLAAMIQFLHPCVLRHVWAGTLRNINEMRTVSVAAMRVRELDLSTHAGANRAARLLHMLQQEAYAWEGYMTSCCVDSGGLLLRFAWGLPPLVHPDDASRACRACFKMVRVVRGECLEGKVGMDTGSIFCGLIGSEWRHEFSLMGEAVDISTQLCEGADWGSLVVGMSTCVRALTELRVEPIPGHATEAEKRGQLLAFRVVAMRAEEHLLAAGDLCQSRDALVVDAPVPDEPWLMDDCRAPLQPCVWAHLCLRINEPGLCDAESPTPSYGVKVPLPWPARSTACGGPSPLSRLRSFGHLVHAEQAVDRCMAEGGGLVTLVGSYGCGKVELTEHLVLRQVCGPYQLQPVFGAMEMRAGQQWAAVHSCLRGLLALLHPGQPLDAEQVAKMLVAETCGRAELDALRHAGLGTDSSEELFAPWLAVAAEIHTQGRSACSSMSFSGTLESELGSANGGRSLTPGRSWTPGGDTTPRVRPKIAPTGHGQAVARIAMRLVQRLLQTRGVVIVLRVSQGTSLFSVELCHFWALAGALGDLAESHELGAHPLLVLVVCQDQHVFREVATKHQLIGLGPMSRREVAGHLCLCLGGELEEAQRRLSAASLHSGGSSQQHAPEPAQSEVASPDSVPEEDAFVPRQLVRWLYRIADTPRLLEEGLMQLRREGAIAMENGRCQLRVDLGKPCVADWVHTHMVGRIISQMEVMAPELQHALQIASVLRGPFSSMDLAAANRMHMDRGTPNFIVLLYYAKRLVACEDLVDMGFLLKVPPNDEEDDSASGELSCLPRWEVSSYLIHQVVSSTLLQGKRMELKRAILLNRAIYRTKHRDQDLFRRTRTKPLTQGQRSLARRRALAAEATPSDEMSAGSSYFSMSAKGESRRSGCCRTFPSSCIVTARQTTEGFANAHGCDDLIGREFTQLSSRNAAEEEQGIDKVASLNSSQSCDSSISTDSWRGARTSSPAWASRTSVRWARMCSWISHRVPVKTIRRGAICISMSVLLLWPDFWIIAEGSQSAQDAVMSVAMLIFAVDVLANFVVDSNCKKDVFFLTDAIVLVCVLFDVSWAFGKSPEDFDVQRKNGAEVWRIVGRWVKFTASAGRLGRLSQYMVINIVNKRQRSSILTRAKTAKVMSETMAKQQLGRSRDVAPSSALLERISTKLARVMLAVVVVFTVAIISSLQVIDVYTPPSEDLSMASWTQLVAMSLQNSRVEEEIARLEQFYQSLDYWPFHVCRGDSSSGEFECSETLHTSGQSSLPRPSFQKNVIFAEVQITFNFAHASKLEAAMRLMITLLAVLLTVVVAVSLDHVIARLVVSPLARLLPLVRQLRTQLLTTFPGLADERFEDCDEVSAFEKVVSKMTVMVTLANAQRQKEQPEGAGFEWINGALQTKEVHGQKASSSSAYAGPSAAGGDSRTVTRASLNWPDFRKLEEIGVSAADVQSWHFDVLKLDEQQLSGVMGWIMCGAQDHSFAVHADMVVSFLEAVSSEYHQENPYHNWRHACDVVHGVFHSCQLAKIGECASKVDTFSLLVAAACHDVQHPGFNNQFLVETHHELAMCYNDLSPLENMHCSVMFGILASVVANIFARLSRDQYRDARKVCIETILHTDNSKHFELINELNVLYNTSFVANESHGLLYPTPEELDLFQQASYRRLALCTLLHGADISNPCKPWKICHRWAECIVQEFFRQGDEERRLGIPVGPLNNRDTLNIPSSQVAFIELFIVPFNAAQVRTFPPLWELSDLLHSNLQRWHSVRVEEEHRAREKSVREQRKQLEAATTHVQQLCASIIEVRDRAQLRVLGELAKGPSSSGGESRASPLRATVDFEAGYPAASQKHQEQVEATEGHPSVPLNWGDRSHSCAPDKNEDATGPWATICSSAKRLSLTEGWRTPGTPLRIRHLRHSRHSADIQSMPSSDMEATLASEDGDKVPEASSPTRRTWLGFGRPKQRERAQLDTNIYGTHVAGITESHDQSLASQTQIVERSGSKAAVSDHVYHPHAVPLTSPRGAAVP